MSDGTHRSLNMRPGWKKVAERADGDAFAREDVAASRDSALSEDWRADVPDALAGALCEILGGQLDSLFRDQKVLQLENLRKLVPGRELSQLLIDCAIHQAISGSPALDMAVEAAAEALSVWCAPACPPGRRALSAQDDR